MVVSNGFLLLLLLVIVAVANRAPRVVVVVIISFVPGRGSSFFLLTPRGKESLSSESPISVKTLKEKKIEKGEVKFQKSRHFKHTHARANSPNHTYTHKHATTDAISGQIHRQPICD